MPDASVLVIALLAAVALLVILAVARSRPRTVAPFASPLSVWVPLTSEDGGLRVEATVAGRPTSLIADTGSPYLIVPQSLPCAGCTPTGVRSIVSYGDGTSDNAVFTLSPDGVELSGASPRAVFRKVVFGGSHRSGQGVGGDDAVLGLAPVKPPCDPSDPACVTRFGAARLSDPTVGPSFAEQTGVRVIEFDLTRPGRYAMRLGGASRAVSPELQLVAEARLVPRGELWTNGVDHAADFYVARLDPAKNAELAGVEFLIIDTGTTQTLLPEPPAGDATVHFERGSLPLRHAHVDEIPDIYGEGLRRRVGILGNRSMEGHRVVIDSVAGFFRMYRRRG